MCIVILVVPRHAALMPNVGSKTVRLCAAVFPTTLGFRPRVDPSVAPTMIVPPVWRVRISGASILVLDLVGPMPSVELSATVLSVVADPDIREIPSFNVILLVS